MDPNVSAVVLLVGLAVGVDYSLFYLKREREERAAGKGHRAALEAAAATSGRSVLISGLTVMVAMAGLLFSGDKTYLSFGDRDDDRRRGRDARLPDRAAGAALAARRQGREGPDPVRRPAPPRAAARTAFWAAILDAGPAAPGRRPWSPSTGVLVALALPALAHPHRAVRARRPAEEHRHRARARPDPEGVPGRRHAGARRDRGATPTPPSVKAAVASLKTQALASGLMTGPIAVDVNADRTVDPRRDPVQGQRHRLDVAAARCTSSATSSCRRRVGKMPGVTYAVTGGTAASADENTLLKHSAPLVFGFVLTFAFLLLLVSFRSVVIAGKAIVLNLLSVGAAYGVLVIVFQWGWGESLLNFRSNGGIAQWLPIFMFVILFGLSMDYHVFILSRIREAFDRGMKTEDAVAHGIKTTAGVVTSAAVVMVGVFSIFATLPIVDMKEMGIGLAAAVLIDATIVRALLLPAAMKLLGDWNWYLPNWLGWLPRLDHGDGPESPGRAGMPVPEAA